jgi:hypothetical protein
VSDERYLWGVVPATDLGPEADFGDLSTPVRDVCRTPRHRQTARSRGRVRHVYRVLEAHTTERGTHLDAGELVLLDPVHAWETRRSRVGGGDE